MSNIFNRIGVIPGADTEYSPETENTATFPCGSAEFTIAALVRVYDVAATDTPAPTLVITGVDVSSSGYWMFFDAGFWYMAIGDGVDYAQIAWGREMVARDEGALCLIVATVSADADATIIYTNGLNDGTPSTATGYLAEPVGTPTVLNTALGTSPLAGHSLIDLAFLNTYALTAEEVKDLYQQTMAAGRIPSSLWPWDTMLRAEELIKHPTVWGLGGTKDGRVLTRVASAPTFDSSMIGVNVRWGGFGV